MQKLIDGPRVMLERELDSSATPGDNNPRHQQGWERWRQLGIKKDGRDSLMGLLPIEYHPVLASLINTLGRNGVSRKSQVVDLTAIDPAVIEHVTGPKLNILKAISALALAERIEADDLLKEADELNRQANEAIRKKLETKAKGEVASSRQKEWSKYRCEQEEKFGAEAVSSIFPPKFDSGWGMVTRILRTLGDKGIYSKNQLAMMRNDEIAQFGRETEEMLRLTRDVVVAQMLYRNILLS